MEEVLECKFCRRETDFGTSTLCDSCAGLFCCLTCYHQHFEYGRHVLVEYLKYTNWVRQPVKTMLGSYMNDGTGRGVWIPALEPVEWSQ